MRLQLYCITASSKIYLVNKRIQSTSVPCCVIRDKLLYHTILLQCIYATLCFVDKAESLILGVKASSDNKSTCVLRIRRQHTICTYQNSLWCIILKITSQYYSLLSPVLVLVACCYRGCSCCIAVLTS